MIPRPFVKWAGGKTKLLSELLKYTPVNFDTYYEPFIGGGALLFELQPKRAVIADVNTELINCYKVIQQAPDKLAAIIDSFPVSPEFFYKLREADREQAYEHKSSIWKAARIIYLNKTCYNGLYRVNNKGEFNAPWGKYSNPKIYDWDNLQAVSAYLNDNQVSIEAKSFDELLMSKVFTPSSFVYCDPPYDVLTDTSDFTGYCKGGFTRNHQRVLKICVDVLSRNCVKVLVSNADTPFIRDLWKDYNIIEVKARRSINSVADKRGNVTELLIKNY